MLPNLGTPDERRLLKRFRQLTAGERETLLAFADFLAARGTATTARPPPQQPIAIPRPPTESVVAAMKRLAKTYPMLEPDQLLSQASDLMSAHLLQGRAADEVIDELEALFAHRYRTYANGQDADPAAESAD